MTIQEAIWEYNEEGIRYIDDHPYDWVEQVEDCFQLADWLEELKRLRSDIHALKDKYIADREQWELSIEQEN